MREVNPPIFHVSSRGTRLAQWVAKEAIMLRNLVVGLAFALLPVVVEADPYRLTETQAKQAVRRELSRDAMLARPGTKWSVQLMPSAHGDVNHSFVAYTGRGASYRAITGNVSLLVTLANRRPAIGYQRP